MRTRFFACSFLAGAFLTCIATTYAGDVRTLRSVGDDAQNADKARLAHTALVAGGADNLLPVLEGFRGATPLAVNWLAGTFEAIADNEIRAGRSLPKDQLLPFIQDTSQSPAARRLAYEWLRSEDPELAKELIPSMLLDPGAEFRRDAVAWWMERASQADGDAVTVAYERALEGAVHKDQVQTIVKKLRAAGREIDLQDHFGFLADWQVIGPFDNREMKGFATAYPPEQTPIDLSAEYEGQLGDVSWQPIGTDDDYGIVDIGKQIENYKGSLMYLTTTIDSDTDRSVQLRLGTANAWKLWLNGDLVFEREEYHRGSRIDQYKVPVNLQQGENVLLLKLCQNEQTDDWAQAYRFQLRVCDSAGAAVDF